MPKNKLLRAVLGENVVAIMKAKALKQTQVAAAAKKAGTKIDQTTVSRVARAAYPATVDTLEAVAHGLGVHPWELLIPGRHDERFLAIVKAWVHADEQGRKLLVIAAHGASREREEPQFSAGVPVPSAKSR